MCKICYGYWKWDNIREGWKFSQEEITIMTMKVKYKMKGFDWKLQRFESWGNKTNCLIDLRWVK
jgi:hypothetical protein